MEQGVMKIRRSVSPATKPAQRGVVLFIALIVMVVMSLAAIALMRSVDTTTAVIGNLAFRQASILPANFAIEDAAAGLFGDANTTGIARIADVRANDATQNYYATHNQGWDDVYGVPTPLQTKAAALALGRQVPAGRTGNTPSDGAGNIITYVVERMCNTAAPHPEAPGGESTRSWCDMAPPKQPPGATINDPSAGIDFRQVFYRVTVRVDGPPGTNTVSFAQAMLR
jgi:Tfp pilus assembly protein PilX